MFPIILKWLRSAYRKVITSIAFLPAIISLLFLGLSFLMVNFDFSEAGKSIKSNLHWLSLKDASTARTICSSIAGGIISLAVFSFSMVMILLSQAAAQMSNRILGQLISNRFQQIVLGFYIGTIVYALFLLSTIREHNTGIYVPAISTYLLITLTVVDIFLFIYFLHYITQSVKFETIIHQIYDDTKNALKKACKVEVMPATIPVPEDGRVINAYKSGLYEGFSKDSLVDLCKKENALVFFLLPVGSYVMENTALLAVTCRKELSRDFEKKLNIGINIGRGQEISTSFYYGFRQLMEIAIKALSPGINDPGTATISLQAIGDLLAYRLSHFPLAVFEDIDGERRIVTKEKTFEEMFEDYLLPIWDYGKKDRLVQQEMLHILTLLNIQREQSVINKLLREVQDAIKMR
ncbi:MAG: DUF2254 domain-containing protein [Flavitalea sp.]